MATRSAKRRGNKKSQKPHMKVRDLKARKDAKGGFQKITSQIKY